MSIVLSEKELNRDITKMRNLGKVLCMIAGYLAIYATIISPVDCSSAMKRLYEDLFTDYNKLILPVANNKTKVTVTLGLKLGQILDLNLKQQILSTNVWVEQTWHDYKLEWRPELYDGIDMIHVPAENIWIPDIVLFNNADGNYELTLVAKARLYSNGTVVWKPPTMFRSTCEIDVEYFPFDIQTCFLRFGSWTYAGDELELKHVSNQRKADIGIDLSQFYKNVEWDIIDVPSYYNENYYESRNEPYPDITFKIVIRRKMLFYLVNLILPVALMTFMTVSVFYLPSDSNEKVTLSISILTSLIVFFLLMLEIIPASSLAVPLFGKYLLFTLALVSLSACLSVYVLNIHHRSPSVHSMSPRVRQIFLKTLPRLLRLNRPDPHERSSLNRFRKKKIAQQLLKASTANKVYDLAQPLAASLSLIETLHKSYEFNPKDDQSTDEDNEGRYFRRYVDNYISRMKSRDGTADGELNPVGSKQTETGCNCSSRENRYCCEHNQCCSSARLPNGPNLARQTRQTGSQRHRIATSCCGGTTVDRTESSADMMRPLVSNKIPTSLDEDPQVCTTCSQRSRGAPVRDHELQSRHSDGPSMNPGIGSTRMNYAGCSSCHHLHQIGMLNDDTLDMTFDYDDQEPANNTGINNSNLNGSRCQLNRAQEEEEEEEDLPSPPPPPIQLSQLSDSMKHNKSGRLSSCSKKLNLNQTSSDESSTDRLIGGRRITDQSKLVDQLINSINLISNAQDEIDTTTTNTNTTNTNNEESYEDEAANYQGSFDGTSSQNDAGLSQNTVIYSQQKQGQHQPYPHLSQSFSNHGQIPAGAANEFGSRSNRLEQQVGGGGQQCLGCAPASAPSLARCGCQIGENAKQSESAEYSGTASNAEGPKEPSELLMSLRLSYDHMPAHVRAAIRSILFIADTIKNEDDENSAIEDWESMSMVVDRLFLWIFFLLCTFGSIIILALAPSLYDQRASIDDKLRIDIPPSNCSASVYAH